MPRSVPSRGFSISIQLASLILLSLVVFSRNEHSLFLRWDGHFTLSLMKTIFDWPSIGVTLPNLLQGVGELPFPALYDRIPAFVIGHFLGGDPINQPVALTVLAVELFLATVFLGTTLKLSLRTSLIGGWLVCILFMPYMVPTPTYIRIWGNPPGVEGIAIVATAIALIVRAGRSRWPQALILGCVMAVLLGYLLATQVAWGLLAAPVIAYFFLVAFLAAESKAAATKIAVLSTATALVLAAIFGPYYYGLYGFSVPTFFWSEFVPTEITMRHLSFFFHPHEEGRYPGRFYVFVAILGAALSVRFQHAATRPFALGYVTFVGLLLALVGVFVVFFEGVWRGPPPGYLDMLTVPLQALFAAVVLDFALVVLRMKVFNRHIGESATSTQVGIVLLAVLPWTVTLARSRVINSHWLWPPPETPITRLLSEEIAIAPGKQFRGRAVNLAGGHDPQALSPFYTAWDFDEGLRVHVGNEHRYMGLWFFNIPTFNLSTQFYSPFYNAVNMRLLNRPYAKNARPQTQTTEFVPHVMRSLGISWVLDDTPRSGTGIEMVAQLGTAGGKKLYVHRVRDANLGNWSPTHVLHATDIREAIQNLASSNIDLRQTAVAFEPLPAGLVPAQSRGMTIETTGLTIEASSASLSLLLLPLEYSHCLTPSIRTPYPADFKLVRLNVNLTGILFREQISAIIQFRYGPFRNAQCRIDDWKDARRLKLAEIEGWWPQ